MPDHDSKVNGYWTRSEQQERAVLVHVPTAAAQGAFSSDDARHELQSLSESAGVAVVGLLAQNRREPDRATYVGKGKVTELKEMCQDSSADVVVFGHDLSPAQGRNLEDELDLRVVDRSQLIMDLFATRARTYEARLQVELAQLEYSMPRLRRLWTHLDRYKGGGVGTRGPGETQIESDRREIRRKIAECKKKLTAVVKHHEVQRQARTEQFTVGLIGYTNAGKSTLFNRLTESHVLAENRPFTTLDTRTRSWRVDTGCTVLLSDTIGFIQDLPHHLIASFRATLAEAIESDLLLHVLDGSRADFPVLNAAVEEVLHGIGAADRPRVLVMNKLDLAQDRIQTLGFDVHAVAVSARTGEGLKDLANVVLEHRRRKLNLTRLRVPFSDGAAIAAVEAQGEILERTTFEDGVELLVRLPASLGGRLRKYSVDTDPV